MERSISMKLKTVKASTANPNGKTLIKCGKVTLLPLIQLEIDLC